MTRGALKRETGLSQTVRWSIDFGSAAVNGVPARPSAAARPDPPRSYDMVAALVQFSRHGWGIHVVSLRCGPEKPGDHGGEPFHPVEQALVGRAGQQGELRRPRSGGVPRPMTADEYGKFIAAETEKWRKVVEFAGVSVD